MTASAELPTLQLFNSMGRRVQAFAPMDSPHVGVYCCGPTVYNFQHIGNLRTYIFEDLLIRTLRYAGYSVRHVMNITDVGHLVSDADDGEDKMVVAARREGKRSHDIAQYYTDIFFNHCEWLHIIRPDVVCKATDHIEQMITLITRLEEKGFAYEAGGNIYFDVSKLADYGKLANLDLAALQAGARIDVDDQKRNPHDFALWFTKSKFENQELQWDSPWGRGYPGWHIECSAMAETYLGEEFDIHCGGIDHIPVHHTNEIAQSEGAHGKPFAHWWMHGGFLVLNKEKMSKSTGEFLTLDRLVDRGYNPLSYRLFCLGGTYRNELAWNWEALDAAENRLRKFQSIVGSWKKDSITPLSREEISQQQRAAQHLREFEDAVYYDLGVARALAVLQGVLADKDLSAAEKFGLFLEFDRIFGLGVETWEAPVEEEAPAAVTQLAEERRAARQAKDFAKADEFRDKIAQAGYLVEDTPQGFVLKKK